MDYEKWVDEMMRLDDEIDQLRYRKKYIIEQLEDEYIDVPLWDAIELLLDMDDDLVDRVIQFCREITE